MALVGKSVERNSAVGECVLREPLVSVRGGLTGGVVRP